MVMHNTERKTTRLHVFWKKRSNVRASHQSASDFRLGMEQQRTLCRRSCISFFVWLGHMLLNDRKNDRARPPVTSSQATQERPCRSYTWTVLGFKPPDHVTPAFTLASGLGENPVDAGFTSAQSVTVSMPATSKNSNVALQRSRILSCVTGLVVMPQSAQLTQDAQLSQRDRAVGCIIVFAKSRRLKLEDNILRTL